MKKIYFLFLVLLPFIALSQHKYDHQWPFGYGSNFDAGFGISLLNFTNGVTEVEPYQEIEHYEIGYSGSFICDTTGQLMLMTNNCDILDHNFNIIENGEDITPGEIHDNYCPSGDYPSDQCTLFLPDMNKDSITYLVHKDAEIDDELQDVPSRNLYLSTIVKRTDGSFYVKEKQRLLLHKDMIWGRLISVLNADMDKWWIWALEYDSNRFYKFLIGGQDTVQGPFIQEIGPVVDNYDLDAGQAAFSPDGQMLAINSANLGVILYRFDSQSGTLSNTQTISYPNMENARGLVFSPNSRFIYVGSLYNIYQIDLTSVEPDSVIVHLGSINTTDIYGWPVAAGQMYLGPDCRLYISPSSSARLMHVIHQPNKKGLDCELEVGGIFPPSRLNFDLLNLPMYRFNGSCDSTISWGIISGEEEIVSIEEEIRLYPNPASDHAILNLPLQHSFKQAVVWNMQGQEMLSINIPSGQQQISIALDQLAYGVYFIKLQGDDTYTLKLLKN